MSGTHLVTTGSPGLSGLHRASGRRQVAGLCAGLSTSTGIDVTLVRIAMVVLALGGGVGVALYACGWALLPVDGEQTYPLGRVSARAATWTLHRRVRITAIICFITWLLLSSWSPFAPVPVVVGVVLLLVHHQRRATSRATSLPGAGPHAELPPPTAPASPAERQFTAAVEAWQARLAQLGATDVRTDAAPPMGGGSAGAGHPAETVPPPTAGAPAATGPGATVRAAATGPGATVRAAAAAGRPGDAGRPARRLRHGRLGWGLAVALAAWCVGELAGLLPLHMAPMARTEVRLSLALAVVGLGLVVAGVRGVRPRLLVPLGVVLVAVLGADHTGLATPHQQWLSVQAGSGTASDPLRFVGTRTVHALPTSGDVAVQCRASDLTLTSSDDVQVQVDYRLRAADLTISGDHVGGSMHGTAHTAGDSAHVVRVTLDAAACHVEVRHA